jgi:hypothetical protein
MRWPGLAIAWCCAAAGGQPLTITNPQRVAGASGGCCTPAAFSTSKLGPWQRSADALCFPGGGAAASEQSSTISAARVVGTGAATASSGGAGCDSQATSSISAFVDLAAMREIRVMADLASTGSLRAVVELRAMPLLNVFRRWESPAHADEVFLMPAGSYRLNVSAGGGVTGSAGSASFGVVFEAGCWANCDRSTTVPVLNAADFTCFLNLFAAGDPAANCDGSTLPPALNVRDFACFLNRFAAGCS